MPHEDGKSASIRPAQHMPVSQCLGKPVRMLLPIGPGLAMIFCSRVTAVPHLVCPGRGWRARVRTTFEREEHPSQASRRRLVVSKCAERLAAMSCRSGLEHVSRGYPHAGALAPQAAIAMGLLGL